MDYKNVIPLCFPTPSLRIIYRSTYSCLVNFTGYHHSTTTFEMTLTALTRHFPPRINNICSFYLVFYSVQKGNYGMK